MIRLQPQQQSHEGINTIVWIMIRMTLLVLLFCGMEGVRNSGHVFVSAFHHNIHHPYHNRPPQSSHPYQRRKWRSELPPLLQPSVLSLLRGGGSSTENSRRSSGIRRTSSSSSTTTSSSSSSHPHRTLFPWPVLPVREMMAELTGTFIIVQMGTASIMSSIFFMGDAGLTGGLYPIAIIWSMAVTIAISCTARISGAHLNPAITMAMALVRRSSFGATKIIPYVLSQFLGAMLASAVNLLLFHKQIVQYETVNGIIRSSQNAIPSAKAFGEYFVGISTLQAFIVELFGTFLLSLVIFSLTHPHNNNSDSSDAASRSALIPPLIGTTVAVLICTLAPLTQAGFNPARDFGPRIVAYLAGWKSVAFFPYRASWIVYILGPIVGAILGAAYTDLILYRPKNENNQ